jgi:hypothetical protein
VCRHYLVNDEQAKVKTFSGLSQGVSLKQRIVDCRLRRRRPNLYRSDRRDCSPIRARPAVGRRRADRRDPATDHRIARNQSLFYLIAVVVFVLPLYATLIVAWIDRRLGRGRPPSRAIEDEWRVVSKSVHFRSPYPIRLPPPSTQDPI